MQFSLAKRTALGFALFSALSAAPLFASGSEASYELRFDATWSSITHPSAYPAGAHFSPVIGASHNAGVQFWGPGQIATNGIETMAETGGTLPLTIELSDAVTAGTAGDVFSGGGLNSPGSKTYTFTATDDHPLVTAVTMIAPSPDWFVGVHDVNLLTPTGWVDSLVVEVFAYDSGTDNGVQFNSSNSNTNPAIPIAVINSSKFSSTVSLGTFTFTRKASTFSYGCSNPSDSLVVTAGVPTMGTTVDLEISDPSGTMGTPSIAFWAGSATTDPMFPCGTLVPNLGLSSPGSAGELLVGPTFINRRAGMWNGTPVGFSLPIPVDPSLDGVHVYFQSYLIDGTARIGLTNAVEFVLGGL